MRHSLIYNQPRHRYMSGLGAVVINDTDTIGDVTLAWFNDLSDSFRLVSEEFSLTMDALLFNHLASNYGGSIAREVCTMPKANLERDSLGIINSSGRFLDLSTKDQALTYAFVFLRALTQVLAEKATDTYFTEMRNALISQAPASIYDMYGVICAVDKMSPESLDGLFGAVGATTGTATSEPDAESGSSEDTSSSEGDTSSSEGDTSSSEGDTSSSDSDDGSAGDGGTQIAKKSEKSNTMLYVGLTAGVLVLGAIVGLAIRKSNKAKS